MRHLTMERLASHWACVCALVALPIAGCSDETTATGGTGGSGGEAGMGGGGGSAGEAGMGGGGTGGTVECESADNCRDDFSECTTTACTDGTCVYPLLENGTPCDEDNECTTDGACAEGECVATPVADGAACGDGAGACQSGSCSGTFACTEAGILEAIAVGGGPHTFDCDGPTTVVTEATVSIDNDVILDGEGDLTVDGNRDHGVLSVAEGVIAGLRGLTVRGARGSVGILNAGGSLDLRNVTVTDNACGDKNFLASGINNDGGRMTIADSTVSNGSHSCVSGILNAGGSLTVTRSTIRDNGPNSAGVLNFLGGDLTIEESAIIGNGVGLAVCWDSSARVVNSTVSNNEEVAVLGVGSATIVAIVASTIVGATAISASTSSFFGSPYCPTHDDDGRITLRSTTISGDCTTETASNGYNIESFGDTCGFDQPTDQVNVSADDVSLGPLQDNGGPTETHALLPGSVAIDVIPEAECVDAEGEPLTTDQRVVTRPQGAACDVGAVEMAVQP